MSDRYSFSSHPTRGAVVYTPLSPAHDRSQPARLPSPPCRPRQRRPHLIHITRLPAGFIPLDLRSPPLTGQKKPSRFRIRLRTLASRERAKRVLGALFSPSPSPTTSSPPSAAPARSASPATDRSVRSSLSAASTDPGTIYSRRLAAGNQGLGDFPMSGRPSLDIAGADNANPAPLMPLKGIVELEKPICQGNGVACYIHLAEPVIYLAGLDHDGTARGAGSNSTAILRGKLQLIVSKSAKIKAVTLRFTGRARTEWPEGIPPEKTQTFEETSLRTQVLPFFNAMYEGAESGYGTQCNYSFREKFASSSVTSLSNTTLDLDNASNTSTPSGFSLPSLNVRSSRSSTLTSTKEMKRLSLQCNQSRSFQKGDSPFGPTPQQKGYKIFHPGVYEYSFELPIDNNSPETIKLPLASVVWMLEATVKRSGTFKPDLQGFREIPVIRSPSEDSLELVEPISISRKWEDQLQYEIMISGKSFPLGSKIPIAFKLTPLAKVQVHKIKIYVSEIVEYYTNNRRVTRKDPVRKLLLLEKVAGKPISKDFVGSEVKVLSGGELSAEDRAQARTHAVRRREYEAMGTGTSAEPLPEPTENILGDIDLGLEKFWGQTEIEMNAQLPTCDMMEKERQKRLVPDCTWKCAGVHHWIKIIMRISRADADDPTGKKRRHFEISIDSPFTILSCRATQANLALPQYGSHTNSQEQQRVCGCPNAATRSVGNVPAHDNIPGGTPDSGSPGLSRPAQAHLPTHATLERPMHLLRQPSFNPPSFDDEEPPPPIATPPPLYDHVIGTPSVDGLADYFARLSQHDDDNTDDEDSQKSYSRGRVNVPHPRTPGGRVARSMEIDREFMFDPDALRNRQVTNQASVN